MKVSTTNCYYHSLQLLKLHHNRNRNLIILLFIKITSSSTKKMSKSYITQIKKAIDYKDLFLDRDSTYKDLFLESSSIALSGLAWSTYKDELVLWYKTLYWCYFERSNTNSPDSFFKGQHRWHGEEKLRETLSAKLTWASWQKKTFRQFA